MGDKMNIDKPEQLMKEKPTLDTIESEGLKDIKAYLQKLYIIWKEFGINEDQKVQRGKIVWKHINNLLQDIVDEEQSFYDDINERIINYTKKIEELSKILSVKPNEDRSSSLILKEENLRQELDNLTKLKHKRIKTYKELRNLESSYCSLLGMEEHKLPSFTGVPSEKDLYEIEQHIQMLKKEKDRRHNKLCLAKKELTTILEVTELTPETPLEKEILSGSNVSLTNQTLKALEEVVTKAHKRKAELEVQKKNLIDKITALWNRLKVPESFKVEFLSKHVDCRVSTIQSMKNELERCEKMKKENIKMFIDALRGELKELWDKCYASPLEQEQFCLYDSDEMTDEVLDAHEAEVEKWKKYHEEIKHILLKINKRKELWELLIAFENKAADPNRFKNRRGNLLQEEKERKKLQKDLPTLENDIFHDIELYEQKHGKSFLYFGEDYRNFVTNQWQERIDQKENEKMKRHKQRLLLTENEALLGTPAKRQFLTSPKSAPSKLFKTNAGISVYRTPITNRSKAIPSTVGKSVLSTNQNINSTKKSSISCKLFPSSSRPNVTKKKDQLMVLRERNQSRVSSKSPNSTTYSQFANELNSTYRRSFRSSVLSTKKPGGTRILQNTSKNKRKSVTKSLRRSMRNTSKTAAGLTPARGKLGLPFLI